jgi:hypothetical protein
VQNRLVASSGYKSQPVRLRRDPKSTGWYFGQKLRERQFYTNRIFGRTPDFEGCSATELRRALRADRRHGIDDPGMLVSTDDDAYYDDEECSLEPIEFALRDDALSMTIGLATKVSMAPDRHASEAAPFLSADPLGDEGTWYDEEAAGAHALFGVLQTFFERNHAKLHHVVQDPNSPYPLWRWRAEATVEVKGRSLDDAMRLGRDAIALGEAFGQAGEITREIAADLIRAGHAAALIGMAEGPWLDVKSQHYEPGVTGNIKLAQAVAKFANAEHGGLLVVGMAGKKLPGAELVKKLSPVPISGGVLKRYQDVLRDRLYPPPEFLSIEVIGEGELGLVLLIIPPQPEELKPFLVHGAIVDGKADGTFISIVRRRGESSIPATPAMIHSTLSAGRALLRRGELPGASGPLG